MMIKPIAVLTFILFAPAIFWAQDDTRATATWKVQKYDLTVTLPASEADRTITAKAALTVLNISSSPASTLSLRISSSAEVSAVTVNGTTADFTKREEKVGASVSLQRLSLRIPAVAPNSTASVVVDYKLALKDNSGAGAVSPAGALLLPLSFWYPTPNSWFFARGSDYAPFQVRVNSLAAGHTLITSGSDNSGTFDSKLNGQPFLITGSWDTVNASGVVVHSPKGLGPEARARAAELAALASEAKTFITGLLGSSPDAPLRIVGTRRGSGFAQNGTILVDEGVFRRSKVDELTAMNIAEAVTKIWIGGSAAVIGDGQGAVREGLPRFIATEFIESKYGKDVADVERVRQRTAYSAVVRRDAPLSAVSPLDDYYFAEVANKGAMIWRLLDRKAGRAELFGQIQAAMKDGSLELSEIRAAFASHKALLDHLFDEVTDTNLLVGLPQSLAGESKVALRNSGTADVTVSVEAEAANGEKLRADSTIRAGSFGEVAFKTSAKIVRVEIDTDKLYPQVEYADDVAPKELSDGDPLLAVKRAFDKQDHAAAEKTARIVLRRYARFDDVRVLLARSLLSLGRNAEAEREFRAVIDEKLPTARSLAWANVGLGEVAAKAGQTAQAVKFAEAAILADADYGASFAARALRNRMNVPAVVDDEVKAYFVQFDKAAASNRKAELDAMVMPGEVGRFAGGISGSTEQWTTQLVRTDRLDANTVLAEATLNIKLLNRDAESGTAVFRLVKTGGAWKLAAVEIFEVR